MAFDVVRKTGAELSNEELTCCATILRDGKAVDIDQARRQLPRACAVAILRLEGTVVGLGAVKSPRPNYARQIASDEKSGIAFDPAMHELGYTAVLEQHQGKGGSGQIVGSLLREFPGPLWATTYNEAMKKTLKKHEFKRSGTAWLKKDRMECLSLWIKPAPH
jgi:hypothetical protein